MERKIFKYRFSTLVIFFLLPLIIIPPPLSDSASDDKELNQTQILSEAKEQEAQVEKLEVINQALSQRDQIIKNLLERIEILEKKVQLLNKKPPQDLDQAGQEFQAPQPQEKKIEASSTGQTEQIEPPLRGASPKQSGKDKEEELFAESALERLLVARSRLLLPPWKYEIEPSFTYVHASSDNISIDEFTIVPVLVVGEIISERVRRNIIIPAFTFRLGLPNDSQTEVRVPLRYESERTILADGSVRPKSAFGLGDLEFALSKHLMREKGAIPDILGSLRWKTPTGHSDTFGTEEDDDIALGTGFHGFQFMLTALKIRDPLALFGSVAYTANLSADKPQGRVNPGDTVGFNLGLALALNLETSINFGWEQRFTFRTSLDGADFPGSSLTVGTFNVGVTYNISSDVSLDLAINIGLTRDAPDLQATIALPIR